MSLDSYNKDECGDENETFEDVLKKYGVPQDHLTTIINLCRDRISSTSVLKECIDSYECPAGLRRKFFFSEDDFSDNYKGAERKIEDLRGCQSNVDCRYKPEDIED